MVADAVRQRQAFARKIKSLTAMGRMSAYVLVGLPIALFFVLSVQFAWWILLLGAEIAACLRAAPEPEAPEADRQPDPWIGLAALDQLGAVGRPTIPAAELAETLELGDESLALHLEPLVDSGLLESGLGGYRLALPTRQVRLATAMAVYRRREEAELEDHPLPPRVAALKIRLRRSLESELEETTLADLLGEERGAGLGEGPEDTVEVTPEPFGEATVAVASERAPAERDRRAAELAGPKRAG